MSESVATTKGASPELRLSFDQGTIVVDGLPEGEEPSLPGLTFDPRIQSYRAPAIWYRAIVEHLRQHRTLIPTTPATTRRSNWSIRVAKEPFPHQTEGLKAWWKARGRGVVVLPTGTGKTHLANLAIEKGRAADADRHADDRPDEPVV